jgi:hypothetical protein
MPDDIFRTVQELAVRRLAAPRVRSTNLHLLRRLVKANTRLLAHRQEIPVPRDTVVVFADDAPLCNWGHPCRYLLHDAHDGTLYQEVKAEFPPDLHAPDPEFVIFHRPVLFPRERILWPVRRRLHCPIIMPAGRRYAVLFSGASNNRHTNDLEFLYRTLRDDYHFSDDDIYCLNYDGTINYSGGPKPVGNWPGDNTPYRMPVKAKGTKADLESVLDDLKGRLKADDLLIIHTNNHGGWNGTPGSAYLVTYSGADYSAADFAAKLGTLPKYRTLMVMMEQCHSGGFNAPVVAHSTATYTTVASACVEANNSIGGAEYDPFARDWISAMALATPTGGALVSNPDMDGTGRVSAHEAYDYADANHDPYDTPNYNESAAAAGATFLGQRYRIWWWYCPILVELLQAHYVRLPGPQFESRMRQMQPELDAIVKSIDQVSEQLKAKTRSQIEDLVRRTF